MTDRASLVLRLGVSILVCSILAATFLCLAHQIREGPLTEFDTSFSQRMKELRERAPALRFVFYGLTLLGAFETMLVFVPLGGLILWARGQRTIAIVWLVTGIGVGLCNSNLKWYFDRPRPPEEVRDCWVYETNESYPSGHASGSVAIFGLLGFLLVRTSVGPKARALFAAGITLLIVGIGFSRLFLCAHYFSDVLGGYLLGGIWLTLAITTLTLLPTHSKPATS